MEEEWKDVVGFEDYYMVSNFGRVMSKDRYVNDRGTIILRPSKIIAYFHNKYGYCQTSLSKVGFVGTGNKYGVTDSAIRKWCIKLGLPTRKKRYITKFTGM